MYGTREESQSGQILNSKSFVFSEDFFILWYHQTNSDMTIKKIHALDLVWRADILDKSKRDHARLKRAWDFQEKYENADKETKRKVGFELPKVYLWKGKWHIQNGNHRAFAQRLMGRMKIECEII